jgi:glycosyltransferase involved in cell wall biosynthesis
MKVAVLSLHFAEYAGRLALALSRDHTVLLVLNEANARDELSDSLRKSLQQSMTVEIVKLPRIRDPRVLASIFRIYRCIRRFAPDVLHIQEYHQAFTGLPILSIGRDTPVVITVHDPLPHTGSFSKDSWRWKLVQWFRRRSCRMIVHGNRNRTDLISFNAATRGRVDIVPHGILGRDTIDENVDCEPHTFLFFGRIEEYKGLQYLLDAGDILERRGHEFRVVIAGHGSDLERHRQRIEQAAWAELNEQFIPTAEIPALFKRALAVVLPYTDATQSGVSAMAFAYSRPVIATDVGDVPEVVAHGKSGLIVPPCDAEALADAMQEVLNDRQRRDMLAAGAAQTAKEALSWGTIAKQTQ